ncbi:unnamed protein product [Caretta caretta]
MYGKVVFFLASEDAAQETRAPLPLGCKDPTLRHIFSFRRQVQLLPPAGARDEEALEGSFLVPYQGARYRVFYSTGEARCYLCRSAGHVRRDCPLARGGGAPETPETRQDIGPVAADAPGCPAPETNPPPTRPIAAPVRAQEIPSLQRPGEQGSSTLASTNPTEPMEEGVARILSGIGEGPPQGEAPAPHVAPPLPPRTPKPSPPPPDTTPANQPPDDAMEGWTLVQGKRGKRKARAPLHPPDAEAPRKTRKGGTAIKPPTTAASETHPLVSGGEDGLALEGRIPPPRETLPSETSEDAPSAWTLPEPPADPEATVEAGPRGEAPGVAGVGLSPVYAEIEALDLIPVTQGGDDLLPAGLELGSLTPASLSPCSLPLIVFPGEHPAESGPPPDAMAAKTTMEPAPSIIGSPLPYPLTLDSAQEALSFSCLPPAPQSLTPAPAPTPAPAQVAIFPLPSPSTPRCEMNLITPACQTPRRWSAPCLPALADHEAVLRGPSGNTSGIVTPPPHELWHALRKFLEHTCGARDRAQLALRLWGDFDQILQATRALLKEGRGQGKRGAAAYERARSFRRDLLTHGMGHGLLCNPLGALNPPRQYEAPTPPALRMTPLIIATLNTRGRRMALRRSQVLSYLREGRYSVVFLQETHTDPVLGVNEAVPGHVLHLRRPGPACWHFNNSLLEDESFVMSFREFWLAWREQWHAFPSVRRWMTGLVLREPELRLVLSAYADDILLVVQDPGKLYGVILEF